MHSCIRLNIAQNTNFTMVRSYTRILQAIVMLCCFGKLASSRSREEYYSRLRNRGFTCSHTANASVSFQTNLNPLLSDFNQQSSIAGYYNTSLGDGPDRVYGYYMCRGDVSLQVCNSCILNGTQFASEADCEHVDGIFDSEMCIFRYSNRSTYGLWEATSLVFDFIEANVSNYHQFNQTLSTTMEELINDAAYESSNGGSILGFATMEAEVTGDETIYSLAQCTPDILGVNCSRCLRSGLSSLRRWANGAPAAYATMNKCHLRYDNVSFYNLGEPNVGTRVSSRSSHLLTIYTVVFLHMYYNFVVLFSP